MSDSGREWPSERSKPTAETHSYSDLGGYEPYDDKAAYDKDALGEMVRDFTEIGRVNAKSEVRRRILNFAEDYHKRQSEPVEHVTSEAVRIFQMNRGDFEEECRKRGLEPLKFAQWIVYHWYASREPKGSVFAKPEDASGS